MGNLGRYADYLHRKGKKQKKRIKYEKNINHIFLNSVPVNTAFKKNINTKTYYKLKTKAYN